MTSKRPTPTDWLKQISENPNAVESLYAHFFKEVRRMALWRVSPELRHRISVSEIAADALVAMVAKVKFGPGDMEDSDDVRRFLSTVVSNMAASAVKKHTRGIRDVSRESPTGEDFEPALLGDNPAEAATLNDLIEICVSICNLGDDEDRKAVCYLHLSYGLTPAKIQEHLANDPENPRKIRLQKIRTWLTTLKKRIKAKLEECGVTEL